MTAQPTSLERYRAQIMDLDAQIGVLYRKRRALQERFADEHPVVLPPPTLRTEKQRLVARCPRCGDRIPDG